MLVPGSNLLAMALRVIAPQSVLYSRFVSRTANAAGKYVTTYADPVSLQGSFQAVPRNLYQQFGLDLQKNYNAFYASQNIIDVNRNVSGDQLTYQGRKYQCESITPWFFQDGWVGVLVVDIGVA